MNILYLNCHDLGRNLSSYGHPVSTPHLERLAEEGVLFRNAFAAAPTCSPSRAAMLTGRSAHESGMTGLVHRGFSLADGSQHVGARLQAHGFETALCGIQHEFEGAPPDWVYRHQFLSNASRATGEFDEETARQAADFLLNRTDSTPFFLACGFQLPHRPFPPDQHVPAELKRKLPIPPGLPDNAAVKDDLGAHAMATTFMDHCAGIVLEGLRRSQHARNTLVIFTTDHGVPFPGAKCCLSDAGMGVALMMRLPENCKKAVSEVETMVSHLDVIPTLYDYLSISEALPQGNSLRGLIEGRPDEYQRDAVFSEINFHVDYEPARCIRTERYKLIKYYNGDDPCVLTNIDGSSSKDAWIACGGAEHSMHATQLFDLANDPEEEVNLANDFAMQEVRLSLEKRLAEWMAETGDPLLDGQVPAPARARLGRGPRGQ